MSYSSPSIAIIGSGFGGLGMAYYLKQAGIETFTIYEKSAGLGGVWRENTYPGAACDVPSHLYSFSFEPHYPWSKAYGPQREILDYQQQLARKYGLQAHMRFKREVSGADFDEQRGVWTIKFTDGEIVEAQILISSVGQLNRPLLPKIKGLDTFKGRAFHSAQWQHDYDFTGKTVASIGTGPSAIQYVPEIAQQVKRLHVFQRSPAWCMYKVDRTYSRFERWLLTNWPWTHTLDRLRIFWYVESVASVVQTKALSHGFTKGMVRLIHWLLLRWHVKDPAIRAKLTPDFPVGCKRVLFSNDWFKTLVQPNVELVTEAPVEITADSVITADGKQRKVDAIVYGTGFAATQFQAPMQIRGVNGQSLHERWKDGAEAYFGITVAGFPNFFMLYGPNTNLGVGTIIFMLERQQRYIVQCVELLRDRNLRSLELKMDAQRAFNEELKTRSAALVYGGGCNSWYLTNGRNTNNWVGYMTEYGRRLRKPLLEHYSLVTA